jgi:hypothetical protein
MRRSVCKLVQRQNPGRVAEHFIALVGAPLAGHRGPGVQVDGDVKRFHSGPEIPDRRLVEILGGVHVANVRIAIDQRAFETELRDRALVLVASGANVLQRHSGEAKESVRMLRHNVRQIVVHSLCGVDRDLSIRDALNAWLRQRQDHALNAVVIHVLKPQVYVP